MVEKNHVVNARMNKFLIEVVGLATLDRLHKLNRGDSLSDKWCVLSAALFKMPCLVAMVDAWSLFQGKWEMEACLLTVVFLVDCKQGIEEL